jgi:hypothetical protein
MKRGYSFLLLLLLTYCQSPRSEVTNQDAVAVASDSLDTVLPSPAPEVSDLPLPITRDELPEDLQVFMKGFENTDSLANYILLGRTYIVEEGPGVYPVISEVNTLQDLLANNELIRFINTNYPARSYYVSQPIDVCNPPAEGIYFNKAENDNLMFNTYESYLAASNEIMTDERKSILTELDNIKTWVATIHVSDKFDDVITFRIHLARVDDTFFLVALDTRGCGA